jgi:hypothetical protein
MSRASVLFGLLVYAAGSAAAGVRAAYAQVDAGAGPGPDAGVPGVVVAAPDGGAAVEITGGGGLFEQSQSSASAAGATASADAPAAPFTVNGYVRGDVFIGKVPGARDAMTKAGYSELSLSLRTAKTKYGDGFAETRVRYGYVGSGDRTFVDVREAYVNTYLGPLDLRLGKQIIVWGRADALNPTNNITPSDFRIRSPLEDDIRLGNVGARGSLRLAPLRLEGVWMPVYLPTELPTVGLPDVVSFGTPRFPSTRLGNALAAGRLHLELPAVEMSVSYLRGYAPLPGLALTNLVFDPVNPSVSVSRTAYQHQVIGFDFSTAIGSLLTLRGEAAYRRPYDYQNRPYAARPDLQYALGADHNFGSVTVIAQYLGRYVFDWQKETGTSMDPNNLRAVLMGDPADLRDVVTEAVNAELRQTSQILFSQTARVQHLGTMRVDWQLLHETLTISTLALFNFTTREWLLSPRIGYRLSDAITTYVGAQIFRGPTDTLFGLIEDELSAGYAELRYTF